MNRMDLFIGANSRSPLHKRIINIPLFSSEIERIKIRTVQGCFTSKSFNQVRVCEKVSAIGDNV